MSASATTPSVTATTTVPVGLTDAANGISLADRRISYVTAQGTHVLITLYGVGSLKGTYLDPDGALNLVYDGTNASSGIVANVSGGTGQAPLRSIQNAVVGLNNFSGVGGTSLNVVNLKNFNLVDGGRIDMTSGVHTLFLNNIGSNTEIHLRQLPTTASTSTSTSTSTVNNGVTLLFLSTVTGAQTLTSLSGEPVITNFTLLANNVSSATSSATFGVNPGPPPPPPVWSSRPT